MWYCAVLVLSLLLLSPLAWGQDPPPPYTVPLRGTTAVLKMSATVEVVNPERILVTVSETTIGIPTGQCQVQEAMSVGVEGADEKGVLVEYHPHATAASLVSQCPYGTLFLLTAEQWQTLTPVFGPAEAAAAAQRIRVQRLLLP